MPGSAERFVTLDQAEAAIPALLEDDRRCQREPLPPSLPRLMVEDAVRAALLEDLGRAGDITTNATIAPDATATAELASREEPASSPVCRLPKLPSA
jgi:hypothetical protein